MRLFNPVCSIPVPYLALRYGRLEALQAGRFPYLPHLPYIFTALRMTRTRTRACVPAHAHACTLSFFSMEGMEGMEQAVSTRLAAFHTFAIPHAGMEL